MPITRRGLSRTNPYSPSGGLNTTFVATSLADVELLQAQNVVIDLDDTIRKRNGIERYGNVVPDGGTAASKIQGIGEYQKIDNTWVEWAVRNGKLYVRDRGTAAWTNIVLPVDFNTSAEVNAQDVIFHSPSAVDTGTVTAPFYLSSISDSTSTWTVNEHKGRVVVITGGAGEGQVSKIASNTATKLELYNPLLLQPDGTSTYAIYDTEKVLILGDGVNLLIAYTNGTAIQIPLSPLGNKFTVWQQRLVVANISGQQNAVIMSQVGNPYEFEVNSSSYSVASPQNFVSSKGRVTGLTTMTVDAERLLVYTDQIIYEIIYSSGIIVKERDLSFGSVNHRSIAKIEGNPTTLANDKSIRIFGNRTENNTGITIDDIGYKVEKLIENAYIKSTDYWAKASAAYTDNHYFLAVYNTTGAGGATSSQPQLNKILVYNSLKNRWTIFTGTYINFTKIGTFNNRLVGANYDDGFIYIQKTDDSSTRFQDQGTAISSIVETKDIVEGTSNEKTFSVVRLWLGNEASYNPSASNITTEVLVRKANGTQDQAANFSKVEAIPQGTATQADAILNSTVIKQFYMVKRGVAMRVKFTNNSIDEDLKIAKIEVGFTLQDNRSSTIK